MTRCYYFCCYCRRYVIIDFLIIVIKKLPPPTFIVFQYVRKSCIHNILISLVEAPTPPQVLIVGANPLTEYTLPRVGFSNWLWYTFPIWMILFVFILYQKLLLICTYPRCYCKWELLILPLPHTQCLVSTNPLSLGRYGRMSAIPIGFFPFIPIRPFGLCIFFIYFYYACIVIFR